MGEDREIDYKEMYLSMVRATEKAINILIQAQQECEELYLRSGGQGKVIEFSKRENRE